MPVTDFVADFLTVVRNASMAKKDKLTAGASNLTIRISELLKEEGFIDSFKVFTEGNKRFVRIHLKYIQGTRAAIQGIRKMSKPGKRWYVAHDEIKRVQGGLGVAIVSTSKGVITDREARKNKLGGELLCEVW